MCMNLTSHMIMKHVVSGKDVVWHNIFSSCAYIIDHRHGNQVCDGPLVDPGRGGGGGGAIAPLFTLPD